jgi:hypothetical protein
MSRSTIKYTDRVRKAQKHAFRLIAWAAQSEDPLEVTTWLRETEIHELVNGIADVPMIDADIECSGKEKVPNCIATMTFAIDNRENKPFIVEFRLVKTPRVGWVVVYCRSGTTFFWLQEHKPDTFKGIKFEKYAVLNTRPASIYHQPFFYFPYRDLKASV